MAYEFEQSIFPDFPRTEHLPAFGEYKPNASSDDKVAGPDAFSIIASNQSYAEEKIDGANCGVMYCPSLESEIGQPFMLRNRNHILRKGYSAKTKGKQQFVPFWNWYYSHVDQFEKLNKLVGFEAVVYGEWLWKANPCTIVYDFSKVPDNFIAYDVWNYHEKKFHPYPRTILSVAGFKLPPLVAPINASIHELPPLLNGISEWSAPPEKQIEPCQCKREGLYIKVTDGNSVIARYKMVRPDYKPGMFFKE